ncbi:transmembrane anchor protein [Hydrogenophaga aquatica]
MYNTDIPSRAELPSTRQLVRSTIIAAVSAVVLLYTLVLPSEYGVDPTGIGRALGLTEMGEIKTRLTAEADADALAAANATAATPQAGATEQSPPAPLPAPVAVPAAVDVVAKPAGQQWRDDMSITLKPGEGTEVKLRMREGEKATYSWAVQGGVVNYDTHGDGGGRSISYEKGRAVPADDGELVAAFTGNHGWFWRNRGQADVKLVLRTGGTYSDIKRVK